MDKARFSGGTPLRNQPVFLPLLALAVTSAMLSGCSSRDADLSEKVAAANAAADRAERAADRAVAAAKTMATPTAQVAEATPESADASEPGDDEPDPANPTTTDDETRNGG
jgi:hypothetical protein